MPELNTFDDGSGSLRDITDATDQNIAATINASAPAVLIGAPPRTSEWLINTATPASPMISAMPSCTVSRAVRSSRTSAIAVNAGIVASVVPLNDYAAVPLMVDLHGYLRKGHTLAEAMRRVRLDSGTDAIQRAAALSLTTLGAG